MIVRDALDSSALECETFTMTPSMQESAFQRPEARVEWNRFLRGRFMVFDGPDGSGKSTQFKMFSNWVRGHWSVPVTEVREPGGTSIGEQIRTILLDPKNDPMTVRCEMLLYMASRAQLLAERIRPALEAGHLVLSDRFVSSTLAYQGTAGGLSRDEIISVARVAVGDLWPHNIVIFDVDVATAAKRLNPLLDRMEQKGAIFHERVRQGYLQQAREDPKRVTVLDATRDQDRVFGDLLQALTLHAQAYGPTVGTPTS